MTKQESKLLEAFRQSHASFQSMIVGLAQRCADASTNPNHYVYAGTDIKLGTSTRPS